MVNLVWWELVRLARRGHTVRSRILLLYALLLAIVVFAFWWSRSTGPVPLFLGTATPIPHTQVADFARSLAFTLLEAQLLLVAIITPAYAAASLSEEKDRGTLSLLLTTALTDRAIVCGKAIARGTLVLAAVASGVPVLVLTAMLGGVGIDFLAAGYALTIGTVILSVGIGVSAACHAPDSRTALIRAYFHSAVLVGGVLIPPFVLLSPFAMLGYYHLEFASGSLQVAFGFGYPIGQIAVACVLVAEATRELRNAGATAGPPSPTAYPEPPQGRASPVVFDSPEIPPTGMGELGSTDPVLWKERHAKAHGLWWVTLLTAVAAVIAVALFVGGGWTLTKRAVQALDPDEAFRLVSPGVGSPDHAGLMLMCAGVITSAVYVLPLAVGVTGCIAGERLRGTLDPLLSTRLDRRRILWAKTRAHAEQGLVFAGGAAAALGAGFGTEGGVPLGLAVIAAFLGSVALVTGFGAWLSVRCASPTVAFRLCLPATVVAVSGPMLVWYFTNWESTSPTVEVLAWCAGVFLAAGTSFWWRAGTELERGE